MKRKSRKSHRRKTSFRFNLPAVAFIVGLILIPFLAYLFFFHKPPCANSISCVKDLSGVYDPKATKAEFLGKKIDIPNLIAISKVVESNQVLGEKVGSQKHIYIDLTNQRLMAMEGSQVIYDFPISSGKWRVTPTGDFKVWVKLRYTRMEGGNPSDGTYYNLPNVPYVMFFSSPEVPASMGFSVHGAYWHNNFGYPMSHGCVNMRTEDVAKIFDWAEPTTNGNMTYATPNSEGTPITIFGQASLD